MSFILLLQGDIIILKKGVIVDNAPPHELVKKIEGKVWNVLCTESEVSDMQQKFRVTNIVKSDTGVALRVLSEEKPTEASATVTPMLEDYYLYVFGRKIVSGMDKETLDIIEFSMGDGRHIC